MALSSIIVDQREPERLRQSTFGGVPVMTALLDAGDYIASCDDGNILAIERKEAGDFLNSLGSDRLFSQVAKLHGVSLWNYLVVCGIFAPAAGGKCWVNGVETGWTYASIQGALLTVQELGCHVLQVASDHVFEQAVIQLANRDRSAVRIGPARDSGIIGEAEQILCSLPGIGPERARAVLDYTGSAGWGLAYLTDPTSTEVDGIGPQVIRRCREALGLDNSLFLTPIGLDGRWMPARGNANE